MYACLYFVCGCLARAEWSDCHRNVKDRQAEISASLDSYEVMEVWPAFANSPELENVTLKVWCSTASVP